MTTMGLVHNFSGLMAAVRLPSRYSNCRRCAHVPGILTTVARPLPCSRSCPTTPLICTSPLPIDPGLRERLCNTDPVLAMVAWSSRSRALPGSQLLSLMLVQAFRVRYQGRHILFRCCTCWLFWWSSCSCNRADGWNRREARLGVDFCTYTLISTENVVKVADPCIDSRGFSDYSRRHCFLLVGARFPG